MKRWIWPITGLVVIAVVVVVYFVWFNDKSKVGEIAGEVITQEEYRFFLHQVKRDMEREVGIRDSKSANSFWESKLTGGKKATDVAEASTLDKLKEFKIQLIKAKENNIVLSKNEELTIKNNLENKVKQYSETEIQQVSQKEFGVDFDSAISIFLNIGLAVKYSEEEQKKIKVDEKEVKSYYATHKDSLDTVKVRHILFLTTDADRKPLSIDKQELAKKNAEEVLQKVNRGESMEMLAEKLSQDPGVKENKGLYEVEKNGQLVPEFETWAIEHVPGETGIIQTDYGYHVMRVESRTEFKDVQEKAKTGWLQEKFQYLIDQLKKDPTFNVTIYEQEKRS